MLGGRQIPPGSCYRRRNEGAEKFSDLPRPYHQQWAELEWEPGLLCCMVLAILLPGAERHQVGTGQGAIAMTCSLGGTLFGKAAVGNCFSAAVSMMGIAALTWVLERKEMGSRIICE